MTRRLIKNPKTTEGIERIAISLGANMPTVYQWRRRGVPAAWRIKIVQASKGRVKLTDSMIAAFITFGVITFILFYDPEKK